MGSAPTATLKRTNVLALFHKSLTLREISPVYWGRTRMKPSPARHSCGETTNRLAQLHMKQGSCGIAPLRWSQAAEARDAQLLGHVQLREPTHAADDQQHHPRHDQP